MREKKDMEKVKDMKEVREVAGVWEFFMYAIVKKKEKRERNGKWMNEWGDERKKEFVQKRW